MLQGRKHVRLWVLNLGKVRVYDHLAGGKDEAQTFTACMRTSDTCLVYEPIQRNPTVRMRSALIQARLALWVHMLWWFWMEVCRPGLGHETVCAWFWLANSSFQSTEQDRSRTRSGQDGDPKLSHTQWKVVHLRTPPQDTRERSH